MSIESVLRELRIDYRVSGDEAVARCPAHDDRHPSWSCNLRTGVHHCFSCGFGGSLVSLAACVLGYTYPEAVIWVNARAGWSRAHQWREDISNTNFSPAYMKLNEASLALFIEPPEDALKSKSITAEAAKVFGVLWNPEHLSWIFPVRDPYTHELWGWQEKNERRFRNYPGGLKKSETLFGLQAFEYGCPAVLVESPVDCVRLCSAGIRSGLSGFGVHVSNTQQSIIHGVTEHLVLALDNDSAGVEETARLCGELSFIRRISIFNYVVSPGAKDPGEMTDDEIRLGMKMAIPALRWTSVYRNLRPVPDRASGQVHWQRELIGSLYHGAWQNSHRNRGCREVD